MYVKPSTKILPRSKPYIRGKKKGGQRITCPTLKSVHAGGEVFPEFAPSQLNIHRLKQNLNADKTLYIKNSYTWLH